MKEQKNSFEEQKKAMPHLWKTAKQIWEDYGNNKMNEDYCFYMYIDEYTDYMGISGITCYPNWPEVTASYYKGEEEEENFDLGNDEIRCTLNIDGCSSAEDFFENAIEAFASIFEQAEKKRMTDDMLLKDIADMVQTDIDRSREFGLADEKIVYYDCHCSSCYDAFKEAVKEAIRKYWDKVSDYILEHTDATSIEADDYNMGAESVLKWSTEKE